MSNANDRLAAIEKALAEWRYGQSRRATDPSPQEREHQLKTLVATPRPQVAPPTARPRS